MPHIAGLTAKPYSPDPLVAYLGRWIPVEDGYPDDDRKVAVWRYYGYVAAPFHPAAGRVDGIEFGALLRSARPDARMFNCDVISTGHVTHWLDGPQPTQTEMVGIQAQLRLYPAPKPEHCR